MKPFVKSNKDDRNDAEAIVEAASRPSMRYVSAKTIEQQDLQSLLRSREVGIEMRTKMHNQLRGLLAEYGIAISQEISHLHKTLPKLFDRGKENELTVALKEMLEMQYNLLVTLEQQIITYEAKIKMTARTNETCQLVQKVEGIGPITAVVLAATISSSNDFKNRRHFAAFLGLALRQHSSGGRERLLGISKHGDSYLRKLLTHGARSVVLYSCKKNGYKKSLDKWAQNARGS